MNAYERFVLCGCVCRVVSAASAKGRFEADFARWCWRHADTIGISLPDELDPGEIPARGLPLAGSRGQ